MKKALLKLMCLAIGLNVFTACYGPAPYPENKDEEGTEQAETKADAGEAAPEAEAAETPENA